MHRLLLAVLVASSALTVASAWSLRRLRARAAEKRGRAKLSELHLLIGNRAYSSWSLRAWLALRVAAGRPADGGATSFAETVVELAGAGNAGQRDAIRALGSPTGKVPALRVPAQRLAAEEGEGGSSAVVFVWDSFAICEHVAELAPPSARLWPADPTARAVARSAAAEMHSGFGALRSHLPMNTRRRLRGGGVAEDEAEAERRCAAPGVRADIERICELWDECRAFGRRAAGGGPFLFGHFTIADAMFAPVVLRFRTYVDDGVLPAAARDYCAAIAAMPEVREWCAAAEEESWRIAQYEKDQAAAP